MDNLYGDNVSSPKISNKNKIIDIDLDLKGNSLLKCIRQISTIIDTIPDDEILTIYFVCSRENSFLEELLKYISNLPNTSRVKMIFRGKFSFELLPLIFGIECEILLNRGCTFLFKKKKLYQYVTNSKSQKKILETFLSRFEFYSQYKSDLEINVDELEKLGYKFDKF